MDGLITDVGNISLALTLIAGFIFGIVQVKQAARDRRERFTLDTLRTFSTRETAELMNFVGSDRFPKTREEARALEGMDNVMMIQFSQLMESLGFLVAEGFIDIDLVDKTLGSYVITCWKKYKVFILPSRERDPYLCEYFEWLAWQMKDRLNNHPREPFYKNIEALKKQTG